MGRIGCGEKKDGSETHHSILVCTINVALKQNGDPEAAVCYMPA
jgi:hypothetical protein